MSTIAEMITEDGKRRPALKAERDALLARLAGWEVGKVLYLLPEKAGHRQPLHTMTPLQVREGVYVSHRVGGNSGSSGSLSDPLVVSFVFKKPKGTSVEEQGIQTIVLDRCFESWEACQAAVLMNVEEERQRLASVVASWEEVPKKEAK